MDKRLLHITRWSNIQLLFLGLVLSLLIGIIGGIYTDTLILFALPVVFLLAYITIVDFRKIFYLLLIFLPLSTEVELPGGFGTDLPSEPLMLLLTGVFLVYGIYNGRRLNTAFLKHPLTLLLLLHISWIGITTLHSEQFVFSFKFLIK